MKLDLNALTSQAGATGEPLDIALEKIDPDPNQPRRTFDEKALQEMAGSIRERAATGQRGVISPVSVRPNPDAPGRWLLNHGERRFRASGIAEQKTIPAVVDTGHDEDDQVLENLQRENLEPMELAEYIVRQIDKGRKAADIARRLGVPPATITLHRALAGLPPTLRALYDGGACRSPRALYDLERLHCKHPAAVDQWAKGRTGAVALSDVADLKSRLEPSKGKPSQKASKPEKAPGAAPEADAPLSAADVPERAVAARSRRLVVRHDGREAVVALEGLLVLQFEDGTEIEVDAGDVQLERVDV